MIKIHLLDLVENSILNFDAGNPGEIIKAEKFLKAQARMEEDISVADVDAVLEMYRIYGNQFQHLIKEDSIRKILNCETSTDLDKNTVLENADPEIVENFATVFEENVKNFFIQNMLFNNWQEILSFTEFMNDLISPPNADFMKTQITSKNNTIIPIFQNYERYKLFDNEFQFATELNYYQVQSSLDPYFFEDDVRNINNTLIKFQKTDAKNKSYLGRVMMALYGFKTVDDDLAEVLKSNFSIGADWVKTYKNSFFKTTKPKNLSVFDIISYLPLTKISKKKEQVMMLLIFGAMMIAVSPLVLVEWRILPIFLGIEGFFYLIFYRILSKKFEARSTSQKDLSFHRKLKKFTYNLVNLNLFLLFIIICALITGTVIGVAILLPHSIAIFLIIGYRIYRKRRKR